VPEYKHRSLGLPGQRMIQNNYLVRLFRAVALTALIASCSSVRHVRPIDKGELAAGASIGGPFVGQIGHAPLPLFSAGINYGITSHIDIESSWEITSALFGILQLEGGCNWRPFVSSGWMPGLIASTKLLGAADFKAGNSRLWPDAGLTAVWRLTPRWYCYTGADNWFETHTIRYDGNKQPCHWLPIIHAGIDFGTNSWQIQLEGKWYVPNINATRHTVRTTGIGTQGCLGVFLGGSYSFGKITE
jgi:hypothetical protein